MIEVNNSFTKLGVNIPTLRVIFHQNNECNINSFDQFVGVGFSEVLVCSEENNVRVQEDCM